MASLLYWAAIGAAVSGATFITYNRFRSLPQAQASDVQQLKDLISQNKVLVLSKSYCPYCIRTKALLSELKVETKVVELDMMDDGDLLQSAA